MALFFSGWSPKQNLKFARIMQLFVYVAHFGSCIRHAKPVRMFNEIMANIALMVYEASLIRSSAQFHCLLHICSCLFVEYRLTWMFL